MILGNKEELAVGWEVIERVDEWIFGRFYLFINGVVVGNPNDYSVDLKGCLNWINDFLTVERNRFEPNLFDMHRDQIFLLLAASVTDSQDPYRFVKEVYEDTFSRFHISHIGMSSFDNFVLLLIKSHDGCEQIIWREGSGTVQNAFLKPNALEELLNIVSANLRSDLETRKADSRSNPPLD